CQCSGRSCARFGDSKKITRSLRMTISFSFKRLTLLCVFFSLFTSLPVVSKPSETSRMSMVDETGGACEVLAVEARRGKPIRATDEDIEDGMLTPRAPTSDGLYGGLVNRLALCGIYLNDFFISGC